MKSPGTLPWLLPGQDFPPVELAWSQGSVAPGLLCAGGDLSVTSLLRAYRQGIFPWFSLGQPILWWSPDPRMVLQTSRFKLHPSFRKTLKRFCRDPRCEIRIDSAFPLVIQTCANRERRGQSGTWIVPSMVQAYAALHQAGFAHSVETWVGQRLVGGLYCVAIGGAVFGESMFHLQADASKIALAALVTLCHESGVAQIDCQQNTRHLASLGAQEVSRCAFAATLAQALESQKVDWQFSPVYWDRLLT